MKRRYYIVIALLSYLLFTLATIPAAPVFELAKKQARLPVTLYGIEGSLWNGTASSAIIPAQPPIEDLRWSLSPAALLLARLSAEVEGKFKQQPFIGHISLHANGELHASDVRSQLPATQVQALMALPLGELAGDFNLNIESLTWDGQGLPVTRAKVIWLNAAYTLAETVALGQVEISLSPAQDNDLKAIIKNKDGMISISGEAVVSSNKRFQVDLSFTPNNNTSDNIKQSLAMFARRQPNGSYRLKQTGNLRNFGL